MKPTDRKKLEHRLAEIDAALGALRRGYARGGQRPPKICELMQEERRTIVRKLELDQTAKTQAATWRMPQPRRTGRAKPAVDPTAPTPPHGVRAIVSRHRASWCDRLLRIIGWSKPHAAR